MATGVLLLSLPFFSTYRALYALCIAWGVANGAVFPANFSAMGAECPPELRSRGFALLRLANNLGMTAAPILGGYLITIHPGVVFFVDGGSCIAAALLLWILFPGRKPTEVGHREEAAVGHSMIRDRRLWIVFLAALGVTLIVSQVFTTWPPYLRSVEHLTELQIGFLFAISTTIIVPFQMPLSHGVKRYSHYRMAALGAMLYGAAFLLMSLSRGSGWQIGALMIWTTGEMLVFPALATIVSDLAPAAMQGKYQGVYSLAFSVGLVLGPAGGSYLAEHSGWPALWAAVSALALGSAFILFVMGDHSSREVREQGTVA